MRIIPCTLLLLALAACSEGPTGSDVELEKRTGLARCDNPAPLNGTPDPRTAGSFIVVYKAGTDVRATTARLAEKHGFQPKFVYEHALQGFAAQLSLGAVGGVRCEPEVHHVSHDGVVTIAD